MKMTHVISKHIDVNLASGHKMLSDALRQWYYIILVVARSNDKNAYCCHYFLYFLVI